MDSLTQITVGAAAGGAFLGKKAGNKTYYIGAALGTLSDLDVLLNPFYNNIEQITLHRGFSHSILFTLIAAPVIGALLFWIFRKKEREISYGRWTAYSWIILAASITVDTFNNYGTQIFQPFWDYPVSIGNMFVIDPFFTLPLLAGVITAMSFKTLSKSRRALKLGIGVTLIYLFMSFLVKAHVQSVFSDAKMNAGIEGELMTGPTPFNTFLWTGYIENEQAVYIGDYSIFDDTEKINFIRVEKNKELLDGSFDTQAVKNLVWFSRDYYSVTRNDDGLFFHDLRFGRSDLWLTDNGNYTWTYKLIKDDSGKITSIERKDPEFSSGVFGKFLSRMLGD